MLRRGFLIGILILGALLISVKAVFWTIGSFALSAYRTDARIEFQIDDVAEIARRSRLLAKSVRYMPEYDPAWREYARFAMHYADHKNDRLKQSIIQALTGMSEYDLKNTNNATNRAVLLDLASRAFQKAEKANRLDSHSMFWGSVAKLNWYEEIDSSVSPDIANEVFTQMKAALELDSLQPDRFFVVGQLAIDHGRVDEALDYLRHAVDLRVEYFRDAAALLHFSPKGIGAVKTLANGDWRLQKQLYQYLMDRWHIDEAHAAWRNYRKLAGLPMFDAESELVSNGSFSHDIGSMFHDWVIQEVPGTTVKTKEEGALHYIAVEMNYGPANYFHLHQDVPVEPGSSYELKAKVKAQGFQVGSHIGIEAVHPMSPGLFSAGDQCIVSAYHKAAEMKICQSHFTELNATFTVPETLPVVRIRFRRHAQKGELNSHKGIMSLTSVSLTKLEPNLNEDIAE